MHKVCETSKRARLGTAASFCEVGVLKLRTAPICGPTAVSVFDTQKMSTSLQHPALVVVLKPRKTCTILGF